MNEPETSREIPQAQGRTAGTPYLLVIDSPSRQALYAGITRGREAQQMERGVTEAAPPLQPEPDREPEAEA